MTKDEFIERLAQRLFYLGADDGLWEEMEGGMRQDFRDDARDFLAECGVFDTFCRRCGSVMHECTCGILRLERPIFVLKGGEADGAAGGPYHGEAVRPDVATGSAEAQEIGPQLKQSADAAPPAHHDGSAGPQNSARTEPAGPSSAGYDLHEVCAGLEHLLQSLGSRIRYLESAQVSGGEKGFNCPRCGATDKGCLCKDMDAAYDEVMRRESGPDLADDPLSDAVDGLNKRLLRVEDAVMAIDDKLGALESAQVSGGVEIRREQQSEAVVADLEPGGESGPELERIITLYECDECGHINGTGEGCIHPECVGDIYEIGAYVPAAAYDRLRRDCEDSVERSALALEAQGGGESGPEPERITLWRASASDRWIGPIPGAPCDYDRPPPGGETLIVVPAEAYDKLVEQLADLERDLRLCEDELQYGEPR